MINLPAPEGWTPSDPKNYKGVFRHPTLAERELIARFIANNSVYAAEIEFGISTTMGRAIRKQFGIPARKKGRTHQYTKEDAIEWMQWMKDNKTTAHFAAVRFGCHYSTISRYVNALKANSTVL